MKHTHSWCTIPFVQRRMPIFYPTIVVPYLPRPQISAGGFHFFQNTIGFPSAHFLCPFLFFSNLLNDLHSHNHKRQVNHQFFSQNQPCQAPYSLSTPPHPQHLKIQHTPVIPPNNNNNQKTLHLPPILFTKERKRKVLLGIIRFHKNFKFLRPLYCS